MLRRLEDNEHNHPNSYPPIEADIESSERLLSVDLLSSPGNDMLQSTNEQRRELPAAMWPQYLASLAAVLGGMVMGTTIGNFNY